MKLNINKNISKTNDFNVLKSNKIGASINMNLRKISKTTYQSGSTIYNDSRLWKDEIVHKGLLMVRVPTNESRKGIIMRTFHLQGYSIFLENMELSQNLQVYKAADKRNDFYIINKLADRKDRYIRTTKAVLNKEEMISFFIDYIDGLESYLPYDYDDSLEDGFYVFIK